MSALSDWIKERRAVLKLTQVHVASRLGLHQAQISQLENGKLMPDADLMTKIDAVFGKFAGSYVPVQSAPGTKKMSDRAKDGLKAYRESRENGFFLKIDNTTNITADRNQYILKQGANASYFTDLKSLVKYLVALELRQSSVSSLQEILDKLDEIYGAIEERFDKYDPANVTENREADTANGNEEDDE